MRSLVSVLPVAIVSMGMLAGCTSLTPAEEDPVQLRLTDLEARLMRIERVVNNESLIELAGEVDELRAETRELRGEVESLRFETESAADRQRELYLDVDQRLQALEQRQAGGGFGGGSGDGTADAGAGGSGGFDGGFGSGLADAGAQNEAGAPAGAQVPGVEPLAAGNDQDRYQAAFELIQARRYQDAAEAFRGFLDAFPDSPLADNAQYWLAETQYVQRRFEAALPEFEAVIESYPQSAKIPDALLKIGYCNFELQRWDAARDALRQVVREYPDTTAARLASQRLERLEQEAG